MEIIRVKVTREVSKAKCDKCDRFISGTSDSLLKHNYTLHQKYCKGKKVKKK